MVIQHARLGRLWHDRYVWQGSTGELRHFNACGWNKKHVGEHLSPAYDHAGKRIRPPEAERFAPLLNAPVGWGKQTLSVTIEGEGSEAPTAIQEEAIANLFDHQQQVLERIAQVAEEFVRGHDYWKWMREKLKDNLPLLDDLLSRPAGWLSLIEIRDIRVSDKTRGRDVVIGFDFQCAWDGEHGFGVQLAKDRRVDVGHGEVGSNIYEETLSIEHPRLGPLDGNIPYWTCRSKLPDQFIQCGWNARSVQSRLEESQGEAARGRATPAPLELTAVPSPMEHQRGLDIVFHANQQSGPTESQFRAVEFLLDHQQPLLVEIAKGLSKYARTTGVLQEMGRLLGTAFGDLEKLLKTAGGWLSLISFDEIRITEAVQEGMIVIGCRCSGAWLSDDEYETFAKLGILLSEKGLLKVGPEDIIFKLNENA